MFTVSIYVQVRLDKVKNSYKMNTYCSLACLYGCVNSDIRILSLSLEYINSHHQDKEEMQGSECVWVQLIMVITADT